MSLRADIRHRLDHLLIPDRLKRIDALKRTIEDLERERSEIRQRIPLWDRISFFSDTEDEERMEVIASKLVPSRRVLAELREEVELRLNKVGLEFPPFAIGVEIERCFRLAREQLSVDASEARDSVAVREVLGGLAARVLEGWVPDFEPEHLFAGLHDPEGCARVAGEAGDPLQPDDRLGVAPVTTQSLRPLVARSLGEGEFFEERERLAALESKRTQLAAAYEQAAGSVSLLDRFNVFSASSAEETRDTIRAELLEVERGVLGCRERCRRLQQQAMCAYPPLAVYFRLVEVLGVLGQLDPAREANLGADGRVRREEVVSGRALVFAALGHLLETFVRAFPDVPIPLAIAQELTDGTARRTLSPRDLLVREFHKRLEKSWAKGVREETLAHAAMQGTLGQRILGLRSKSSRFSRIVFFADSARDQEEDELERRAEWHRREAGQLWDELLSVARITGADLAPLAARDLAIRAVEQLEAVHTDSGSFRQPRECALHGVDAVIATLVEVRDVLAAHYGLEGSRAELMAQVADAPVEAGAEEPRGRFEQLEHPEVVRRLARRLRDTSFGGSFERLRAQREAFAPLAVKDADLGSAITLWDKVHVFTTTPEEDVREELRVDLASLDSEIQEALATVDGVFEQALAEVYPPAVLHYSVGGVISALRAIRAECGLGNSASGKSRSGRYACELSGKDAATAALRAWCVSLVRTYGELPGYHELLEQGEQAGIVEAGWEFEPRGVDGVH